MFGMSSSLHSGSAITLLPSFPASEEGQGTARDTERSGCGAPVTIAYAAAGLGVLHDLGANRQTHYNGHIDDVTCMAISTDGSLAATGW